MYSLLPSNRFSYSDANFFIGITNEVTLDVDFGGVASDPYGQVKAGFELEGKISRKDFGLTWSAVTEAGSVVVSDSVKLAISIQVVKQS